MRFKFNQRLTRSFKVLRCRFRCEDVSLINTITLLGLQVDLDLGVVSEDS